MSSHCSTHNVVGIGRWFGQSRGVRAHWSRDRRIAVGQRTADGRGLGIAVNDLGEFAGVLVVGGRLYGDDVGDVGDVGKGGGRSLCHDVRLCDEKRGADTTT